MKRGRFAAAILPVLKSQTGPETWTGSLAS